MDNMSEHCKVSSVETELKEDQTVDINFLRNVFGYLDNYLEQRQVKHHEDEKSLDESEKKFSDMCLFLEPELHNRPSTSMNAGRIDQRNISKQWMIPAVNTLNFAFKDDEPDGIPLSEEYDKRRVLLAAERKAEYNAFLKRRDAEVLKKKKELEDQYKSRNTYSPRSMLDSVNYEKMLMKIKREEQMYRTLNHLDTLDASKPNLMEKDSVADLYSKILKEDDCANSEGNSLRSVMYQTPDVCLYGRTGGGGEPLRDSFGNLITSRRAMNSGSLPRIQNHSPFNSLQETKEKTALYREELRRQIEEKKRLDAIEKEKAREFDDRISNRIEDQRKQMQIEYENEFKRINKMKEEVQRQQERARKLEEFRRKDEEMRKKKHQERRASWEKNKIHEIGNLSREKRSTSPPVPAVRTKVIFDKPNPVLFPSIETSSEVKPDNVLCNLSEIRRIVMEDQQKLRKKMEKTYEVMNRRTVQKFDSDEDEYKENIQSPNT